ncbi:Hsp70 family protein [Clostridium sp. OS1-26]|uniref:Hsp70 family protein n=1 Tax=Clostridium sp. OS1-26 TaxID=3070681 RepID=UPI0027E08758|nr:Hsp70 family protein [Clostridium sp. OS1-26]WML36899.1 Hsp70 family protein [Clostridium sp. OS1-26]
MSEVLSKSSYVIGIDLGTSTSIASIFTKGKSRLIKIEGNDYIPSVVSFLDKDTKLVGVEAKGRMMIDPANTVASIKRHMGEDGYKVKINDIEYTPEEISAEILRKIVQAAKEQENFETLGEITNAVICIPANFTDNAKQATLKAAEMANLNVLYLLEEPVAAAIMYGFNITRSQKILVYDLGGGTFDVCILDANTNESGNANYDILAKEGINQLGGDDFDQKLMGIINDKFLKENNIDILDTTKDQGISKKKIKQATQKLKEAAEKAKIELSENDTTNVLIPNIIQDEKGELLSVDVEITKEEFNTAIDQLINKTEEAVSRALENSKLTVEDIDKIILVGGSTLVPRIKEKVKDIFGIEPYSNFNPRTIVSEGAAIFGATLSVPSDCVKNDEVKPEGDINISQIVTHNLGIMISGMRFSKLIEKSTEIPKGKVISEEKEYSTQSDNQTELNLLIYQCDEDVEFINEKNMDGDDKAVCIGEFKLTNIPSKPKGEEKIIVKFEVNEENIVNVIATCISNGSENNVTLDVKRL